MLTGEASISATSRLKKISDQVNGSAFQEPVSIDWKRRMNRLLKVLDQPGQFINLRTYHDPEPFETFVELCLIHFVPCFTWRWKAYNNALSDIFTASDEAMAMLLLENIEDELRQTVTRREKVPAYQSNPKYTKVDMNGSEKFRGWHKKGIKRYNKLYERVVVNRNLLESQAHEEMIRMHYSDICGKGNAENHDDDNNNSDSDGSCDNVEAIDGFVAYESQAMPRLDGNHVNEVMIEEETQVIVTDDSTPSDIMEGDMVEM